jgi:hypothetical protein
MIKKVRFTGLALAMLFLLTPGLLLAQEPSSPGATTAAQTDDQKLKDQELAEKRATDLLEQLVGEVQMLKLPENRIRVQIAAADMFWKRNETRARSLFSLAGEGVAEMMRAGSQMQGGPALLRQELVLTAAQHDAALAYQLLATTRSSVAPTDTAGNSLRPTSDSLLEQTLLERVAALDPKLAAQKVEEGLGKGEYPATVGRVLTELQHQDREAAVKLAAKVVSKLESENLLANLQAQTLAVNLLRAGPGTAQNASSSSSTGSAQPNQVMPVNGVPVLGESSFQGLLNLLIDAGLRAAPQTGNQQGGNNQRGRGNFGGGPNANQGSLSEAQREQQNARRLLVSLQTLLPQIDQYLPGRATAVRAKLTELGMNNERRLALNQMSTMLQQGTPDSLLAAAPAAPLQLQSRIYQQAAQKALDAGDPERARQIATEHLAESARDRVLQKIDFQLIARKAENATMDQLRQTLATLPSDDERIDLLLQLAAQASSATDKPPTTTADPDDNKVVLTFLAEAQRLTNRRATNYQQLEQQLRVAEALANVDSARSFEVVDQGIAQLNELLNAAALLNGFEVDIFKEGELPLAGGSRLSDMVARYGQELATLAKLDFVRAQTSAGKFQLPEPRLFSQLAMVRNVLGVPQAAPANNGFGPGRGFGRRRQ